MKGPANILKESEVLVIMSSLASEGGLKDPTFRKVLKHIPEGLRVDVISIICDARTVIQKMIAIKEVLAGHVKKSDPYDVLKSFPNFNQAA